MFKNIKYYDYLKISDLVFHRLDFKKMVNLHPFPFQEYSKLFEIKRFLKALPILELYVVLTLETNH